MPTGYNLPDETIVAIYDALDAGLSQRETARRLGLSVSTVNKHKVRREETDDATHEREWDWNKLEDRCDAAWIICRAEPCAEVRMEILSAALWPKPIDVDGIMARPGLPQLPDHNNTALDLLDDLSALSSEEF